MNTLISQLPEEFIQFLLVTVFSLLIGLSQRGLHPGADGIRVFGTDRTFTFIGILGYILYKLDYEHLTLFLAGGFALVVFLAIFYMYKIKISRSFGLTTILIALLTYCLAPLVVTQPAWLYLLVVVILLIFSEIKDTFTSISAKFNKEEFITLGKFLFMAGVILPLVPDEPLFGAISLSPYKIWLAVVVISTISYLSYLLQKFVFRNSGVIISGILGGLYSSTATTVILAKKSKENPGHEDMYVAGILLAIAMMYLRIAILVLIFNQILFRMLMPALGLLFFTAVIAGLIQWHKVKNQAASSEGFTSETNPLEFKVALLFAMLYIVFYIATYYTLTFFGNKGLTVLSVLTGVSDIDPFLISLFQGKWPVSLHQIAIASNVAILSNNLIKTIYAVVFGGIALKNRMFIAMGIIIGANLILLFFI